jgi:hypothetical protein
MCVWHAEYGCEQVLGSHDQCTQGSQCSLPIEQELTHGQYWSGTNEEHSLLTLYVCSRSDVICLYGATVGML